MSQKPNYYKDHNNYKSHEDYSTTKAIKIKIDINFTIATTFITITKAIMGKIVTIIRVKRQQSWFNNQNVTVTI